MDSLSAAAQDVITRGMPLAKAARLNGVPRTTLRWRMAAMERELAGQRIISNAVRTALILPDVHTPYEDRDHLAQAIDDALSRYKITNVKLLGDYLDCVSLSRFVKPPDAMPMDEEIAVGMAGLERLRQQFPKAHIVYIKGNHEDRMEKYLWTKAPEIWKLKGMTLAEQLELERLNIRWVDNIKLKRESRTFYKFGRLSLLHGHELGICPQANPARQYLMRARASLMVGHIHRPNEAYLNTINNDAIACHCVGTLSNMYPDYMAQNDWVAGYAVVELDADGYYRVDNRKIIDGRIV